MLTLREPEPNMRRPSRIAAAAGFGAAQQRFAQGTPFDAPKGNPEQATVFRGASKPSGRTLHDTRAMFGLVRPMIFEKPIESCSRHAKELRSLHLVAAGTRERIVDKTNIKLRLRDDQWDGA